MPPIWTLLLGGLSGLSLVYGDSLSVCSADTSQVVTSVIYSPLVISAIVPSPTTITINERMTMTVTACPTTIVTTTYYSTTVVETLTPPGTVTNYVPGTTPGTSTVPSNGTTPGTVYISTPTPSGTASTDVTGPPPGTVTDYVPGTTPGTSTVPSNGTTPGTVYISTPTPSGTASTDVTGPPPGTVTDYVPGTTPGTSTVPSNGTTPGTVYISTPTPSGTASTDVTGPPPGTVTDYVPGTTPGTSTVPSNGTTPGTVYISTPTPSSTASTDVTGPPPYTPTPSTTSSSTSSSSTSSSTSMYTPPGNVTYYTPGPTPGTTTIPPNGTTPGTVRITTSTSSTPSSTTPTPGPTFTCDAGGYLIQDHTLYRLNLTTGAETTVNTLVGDGNQVNAMGYNVLDNYLYAIEDDGDGPNGIDSILRIASNGDSSIIGYVNGSVLWTVGDVDTNGHLWISAAGKMWAEVDVDPASSTYGQTLANGTSESSLDGHVIYDWAYLPAEGPYLYGLTTGKNVSLVRWDMDTHEYTFLQNYGEVTGASSLFGAVYASSNATLYASDNESGDIYEFPIPSGTPSLVTDGPVSKQNDGARCVYAADPGAVPT